MLIQLVKSLFLSWMLKLGSLVLGRESVSAPQALQESKIMLPPEVWAQVLEYSAYDDVA